ncbi:MAG: NnrS family protein [Gallionellaceae bacterium]
MPIKYPDRPVPAFALFNLGFRPFFLLAGVFSLVSIFIWGGIYVYSWRVPRLPFSPMHWHAHEMIFGYGMAVAAGFLLTAVRNWTKIPTPQGVPLAGLAAFWLAARVAGWLSPGQVLPMAVLDLAFDIWLIVAIFGPILRAKQHQNIGIASKIILLMLANLCFYLGVSGALQQGIDWGLYSGLYVLLALIYSMARRVLPMFIERGVGYSVKLRNWVWIDRSGIYVFVLFLVADVFWRNVPVTAALAGLLFGTHVMRMAGWHTKGIWNKPLLWVLYVGYGAATFGFLLKALAPFISLSPSLALHAFAVGGIGIITAGMMARISLGHTGRNIQQHSRLLAPAFMLLIAAYVARVLLPMIAPAHYLLWLGIAQVAWLIGFALLFQVYAPILVKPRADGMPD